MCHPHVRLIDSSRPRPHWLDATTHMPRPNHSGQGLGLCGVASSQRGRGPELSIKRTWGRHISPTVRRKADLVEASLGSVSRGGHLVFLGADELAEDRQQFEVAGRSDVVVTVELLPEARRVHGHCRMDILTHRYLHRHHNASVL